MRCMYAFVCSFFNTTANKIEASLDYPLTIKERNIFSWFCFGEERITCLRYKEYASGKSPNEDLFPYEEEELIPE